MADDEWDTGADDGEFQQDRFNTFDPMKAIGGPPSVTEVVKSAEKPSVVGHSFEIDNVAASLSKVDVSAAAATFSAPAPAPAPAAPPAVPTRSAGLPPRAPAPVSVSAAEPQSEPAPGPSPSNAAGNLFKTSLASPTGSSGAGGAFTTKLSAEGLAYFQEISRKPFSAQAVAFLNAYWTEIGDQAEFIFSVTWETMKMADMRTKGVSLIHLYDEGSDVDFVTAIYFYESLFKLVMEQPAGKPWREDKRYKPSMPEMMTSIVRKQELRDKVDADFDGRISLLEVLLHQYQEHCSPADFVQRSMATGVDEDAAVKKARLALEEVNKAIRAYEQEKQRLTAESKEPGVKGLAAVNLLAQLNASPLAETLNASLIKAEAAVRMASRKLGQTGSIFTMAADQRTSKPTDGAMWWMSRDLAEKKKRYGRA